MKKLFHNLRYQNRVLLRHLWLWDRRKAFQPMAAFSPLEHQVELITIQDLVLSKTEEELLYCFVWDSTHDANQVIFT